MSTPDIGNIGIVGSGVTAVATTTGGMVGWINENALVIGLWISAASLVIGVIFKALNGRRSERHHAERLALEKRENEQTRNALLVEVREILNSGQE